MRRHRLLVLPVAGVLLGTLAAPLALAQSTDGQVVHRQSVLTELDATGNAGTSRVFTQLTLPGSEPVELPGQSTSGLRSLSGGDPSVDGDDVTFTDGGSIRTVANNTASLPVSIEIRYAIDGEEVDASDVVGHDGEVAVTYVVSNLTAEPTELTLVDGDGNETTETVDVAVPMVGSLSLTLPSAFREVAAPGGVVVGDGRGGTVVNWSLLLFSPLGSETQEVTWTADATDAVVPSASLQVLPVTPDSFGSLGSTEEAYAGAVDATTGLTEGAREIDTNLRRLADGAGQLLSGLTQLRDGASELSTGLVDARDGAGELSDGLGSARTGAGTLSAGLNDLANGAGRLAAGVGSARTGATELGTGLGDLSAGATQLSDGLTAAEAGGNELATGLGQLSAGAGSLADGADDLAAGAVTLDAKTGELVAGAGTLSAGAAQVQAGVQQLSDELLGPEGFDAALDGIDRITTAIETRLLPGFLAYAGVLETQVGGSLTDLSAGATGVADSLETAETLLNGVTTADETSETRLSNAKALVTGSKTGASGIAANAAGLSAAVGTVAEPGPILAGLFQVRAGVSNPACDRDNPTSATNPCGALEALVLLRESLDAAATELELKLGSPTTEGTLLYGATQVAGGSSQLAAGAEQLKAEGTAPLAAGAEQVSDGADQVAAGAAAAAAGGEDLTDGLGRLAGGGVELSDGAARAAAGSSALVDGLSQLDAGAGELGDGASRASAGAVELNNGLVQLDDGGERLASGLGSAVDGSQRLADGLGDAADGGEQVADGSEQLVEEGTTVLADSVSEATTSSSLQLEQVRAVAARGIAGDGLPYPTVEGAEASAVYQFDLAGVGATDGPGTAGRLAIGLLALLVAFGAGLAARRGVLVLSDVDVQANDRVTS